MKITKFVHSCLLIEMPAPVNRTVLFDPGIMSEEALQVNRLTYLDDICITHDHSDHVSISLLQRLIDKFPEANLTAPASVLEVLRANGITKGEEKPPAGITLFNSPHEQGEPLFSTPPQFGYHFLDVLSHPGDSHSFHETKRVLALPVTAPWGTTVRAVNIALNLHPEYVVPIHDWHWSEDARHGMYESLERIFGGAGIRFLKMETAQPVVINI